MGKKNWFCECFMWFLNILYGTVPWFLKKNIQSRRNVNIDVVLELLRCMAGVACQIIKVSNGFNVFHSRQN